MTITQQIRAPGFAAALALLWVQVYTAGLPQPKRESRLEEITSDLWEHHSDRASEGANPAAIGLESLGRTARGVVADLFWRLQLEGPQMQIRIPIERASGALLLLLVIGSMLTLNVSGYDTSVDSFDGELDRLASIKGWQVGIYSGMQVIAAFGMLAGAVVLYRALGRYSSTQAALSAVALSAAGLLAMVNAGIYAAAAELADQYIVAGPEHRDSVFIVTRALLLMLTNGVYVMAAALGLGVYGFATISARHHLVPGWLGYVATGGVICMVVAIVTALVANSFLTWMFFVVYFALLLLWLIVAGFWLMLGYSIAGMGSGPTLTTAEDTAPV